MTARRRAAPASGGAPEPLVLTGPPGALRATVSVENTGPRRLVVRGVMVHREGMAPAVGAAAGVIAPGTTAQVPVTVSLPSTTPPGDLVAQVEVGGVRRDVVLRVEADCSMRVSPRRLLAQPGRREVRLVAANDGNVAIPLADRVSAALQRSDLPDGADGEAADVRLTLDGPRVLEPGDLAELPGHLEVSTELDPTRRYHARLAIGLADVDVIVLPRPAEEPS